MGDARSDGWWWMRFTVRGGEHVNDDRQPTCSSPSFGLYYISLSRIFFSFHF